MISLPNGAPDQWARFLACLRPGAGYVQTLDILLFY